MATIRLEKLISEELIVEGTTTDTRIDIDNNLRSNERFFNDGGRSNIISKVDKEFTLRTPKIKYRQKSHRRFWEYFLSSPKHFIIRS